MDNLEYLMEQAQEAERARQRIVRIFTGCCGPCNQQRLDCKTPDLCFSQVPASVDPQPTKPTLRQRITDWWRRHVIDHNVWE